MKKVLIAVAALSLISLLGWLYVNKSQRSASGPPDITISANDLFDSFVKDESEANKKFLDKLIEVKGVIIERRKNQGGKDVVILATSDPIFGVSCTFSSPLGGKVQGDTITVKGFCTGYLSDVVLTQCVRTNQDL